MLFLGDTITILFANILVPVTHIDSQTFFMHPSLGVIKVSGCSPDGFLIIGVKMGEELPAGGAAATDNRQAAHVRIASGSRNTGSLHFPAAF